MAIFRGYAAFLDYKYWLNLHPVALGPDLVTGILSFFAWFIVAAVILWLAARSLKKKQPRYGQLARKFASPLFGAGVMGMLLLFFSYEQVPVLGMRLWFLLLCLYFLFEIGRLANYVVIDFPHLRHEDMERARLMKYMSKKK